MKSSLVRFLFLVLVLTVARGAAGAEHASSLNLGAGGYIRTMPNCDAKVYFLEYERMVTPTVALLGRGSGVNYRFNNMQYYEDGALRGGDIGARYYHAGELRGFYAGAALGLWWGDWRYVQNLNRPNYWQGKSTTSALRFNVDFGDRIPIGNSKVSLMPQINVGKFLAYHRCELTAPASLAGQFCNQKSEVNYYFFLGVALGVAF